MKKQLLTISTIFITYFASAQVGVGTTSPHASAVLDVTSTTQGFLPPRMTQAQRNAIVSPAAGLIVWCTNCGAAGEFQGYNVNFIGGTASAAGPAYPVGSVHCISGGATIVEVTNGTTGKTWMDRNLVIVNK